MPIMGIGDFMTLFDNILLETIFILFPLSIWMIYQIYMKNIDKERRNISFDLALFTMIYLMTKIYNLKYSYLLYFSLNVPLILAYVKKRELSFLMITVFQILFMKHFFEEQIALLLLDSVGCYALYKVLSYRKRDYTKDAFVFVLAKFVFAYSYFLFKVPIGYDNRIQFIEIFFVFLIFVFLITFTIFILKKSEDMILYSNAISLLDEEKKLRASLFKITHEIKNPIAVCKGYLDMFDMDNKEHSKKYIPILKSEIEKVLTLLQDFLSISKIKIEKETLDINYLLENVIDSVSPLLKEKQIKTDLHISDEEVFMEADYNRLNQVIINLIKNSIESMEQREKKILTICTEEKKDTIQIRIKDSGIGITSENLKKMSEPFFTTKKAGTGLGVYLSKEIIRGHGGTIRYESEIEKGTQVIITLPRIENLNYT
jgi:signal transduction histidine kinase